MRKSFLVSTAALLVLAACNSARTPNAANFTVAIDRYLATHGQVCVALSSEFPIDVPVSSQHGTTAELTALEHAGLVDAIDTNTVVQSLANSLSLSPRRPEPVKRYTVSSEGQKYLQTVMTGAGKVSGFCYGQKQVASIAKWTEPTTVGSSTQTEVTYNYRIVNLASWVARPDVQQAFPTITTTLNGASKSAQVAGLQLTNKGWQLPQP